MEFDDQVPPSAPPKVLAHHGRAIGVHARLGIRKPRWRGSVGAAVAGPRNQTLV